MTIVCIQKFQILSKKWQNFGKRTSKMSFNVAIGLIERKPFWSSPKLQWVLVDLNPQRVLLSLVRCLVVLAHAEASIQTLSVERLFWTYDKRETTSWLCSPLQIQITGTASAKEKTDATLSPSSIQEISLFHTQRQWLLRTGRELSCTTANGQYHANSWESVLLP